MKPKLQSKLITDWRLWAWEPPRSAQLWLGFVNLTYVRVICKEGTCVEDCLRQTGLETQEQGMSLISE